ncbi:MAG: tetratricopeptide repeat protein, partial [Methanoregulaceae archaeon]|nr:tetratricopeptide repeat protein [Methanoregulaceae archaeon]
VRLRSIRILKRHGSQKGWLSTTFGRYEEAIDCYDHALVADPENAGVLSQKVPALKAMERPAEGF